MKQKAVTLLIFFLLASGISIAQNIPEEIPAAFKAGDANRLEKYLGDKVYLVIPGLKQQLSRKQTTEQLSSFFQKNKPSDFKVIHQSEQNNSGYMIGKQTTGNGEFRVHVLMTIIDTKYFINQLRIENF